MENRFRAVYVILNDCGQLPLHTVSIAIELYELIGKLCERYTFRLFVVLFFIQYLMFALPTAT